MRLYSFLWVFPLCIGLLMLTSGGCLAAQPGLGDFLDERGYLRIEDGFSGSLDPTGYELIAEPGQAPQFRSLDGAGGIDYDARWSDDFAPSVGCDGEITAIAVGPAGEIYFGGTFLHCAGIRANRVVRYQPSTGAWESLGNGGGNGVNDSVQALAAAADGLYVAGNFDQANVGESVTANHIARWDYAGGGWSAVGSGGGNGVDGLVFALAITAGGEVVAGGEFDNANIGAAVTASRVARWSPVSESWMPLSGLGGEGVNGFVRSIVADGAGVYVGGAFAEVNVGAPSSAANIARWDPAGGWSPLGDGVNGIVNVMLPRAGQLYVGGLRVLRYRAQTLACCAGTARRWPGPYPAMACLTPI